MSWWRRFLVRNSWVQQVLQTNSNHGQDRSDLLVSINGVHIRKNLLQISDCGQNFPLLAARDIDQNQSYHREKSDFPEALLQATLHCVGQAELHVAKLIISLRLDLELIPCKKSHTRFTVYIRGAQLLSRSPTWHRKITFITFLNERHKMSPLRFEGQFTPHVTEGVRMM